MARFGSSPDDGHELGHGELMRHQELGFVQRREVLLPLVALDDHLRTGDDTKTPLINN